MQNVIEYLASYNKIVQDISHLDGTIGINFPAQVADALTLRNPPMRDDLVALATMNRANSNRSAGEIRVWTDILRGIHATPIVATPPGAPCIRLRLSPRCPPAHRRARRCAYRADAMPVKVHTL